MIFRCLHLFWLLAALLIPAACNYVSLSSGAPAAAGPESILTRAEQAYGRGEFAEAATLYSQYLTQAPGGPREDAILASAGLSAERAGRYPEAAGHYQKLASVYPASVYARQASLRLPDLYLATDRTAQAAELARTLAAGERDPAARAALNLSQGRALWAQGQLAEALEVFLAVRSQGPAAFRSAAQEGIGACLLGLPQPQLGEVVRQYGQTYPGPEAAFYLTYQSALAGDVATFQAQANYFRQYFAASPLIPQLAQLEANPSLAKDLVLPGANYSARPNLAPPPAVPLTGAPGLKPGQLAVAALLPLTGDASSRYAQDILAGIRLGLRDSSQVGLLEMDTRGEPAQAVRLLTELAARKDVLAVIGPLTSRESLAAAQTAQQLGLPLLAVSQRLGLTEGRSRVFRIFLTPKHQAEAVVRYAVRKQGLRELGILYPDDTYGQTMLTFFQAEAVRQGAAVTARDSYNPQTKNWNEAVARLTGGQAVRRASASYQAKTDFTALYLPDSASAVSQILAQMAYNDVTKMIYLGTSMWITPDLPKSVGRYLSGAIIPEAFSSLSQRPLAVRFRNDFKSASGREPDQFAAYGFDAAAAVLAALNAGARDRDSLVRLWPSLTVEGVTGPFTFSADGDYQIDPALLTIEKSAFKLLKEPGQ
ncbi:MAG: ABC transporter substrate-binding protein [Deltaproteobacteria bacterium]|jgi:ABC-type branched-subunit amino acid transport system substrate-binding protein|nr:ABC transporter substrate-binding protein [Deltaproteobacteria bacterium]